MCVQYIGGIIISTSEEYHEYMGGCLVHRRDTMSTSGDIMIHVGDTMSTSGGYHEYIGGIP